MMVCIAVICVCMLIHDEFKKRVDPRSVDSFRQRRKSYLMRMIRFAYYFTILVIVNERKSLLDWMTQATDNFKSQNTPSKMIQAIFISFIIVMKVFFSLMFTTINWEIVTIILVQSIWIFDIVGGNWESIVTTEATYFVAV